MPPLPESSISAVTRTRHYDFRTWLYGIAYIEGCCLNLSAKKPEQISHSAFYHCCNLSFSTSMFRNSQSLAICEASDKG